ncbi:type II secretion system major pseudopilin GspG [uncultured Treponema sp.]|uniref:type II secretion system major pseudopilin GspG n=1 Tax=uncultured Treponema sp. TaxID=162155 RepID=UPI0025EFEC89|nr:type II secretion system major pseudopilin GspG [uncultured Treponema sp.]
MKKIITRKNYAHLKNKRDSGFTFVETLAVLAVTAILTSQVGLCAHKLIQKARVSATKNQIEQLRLSLQNYFADCARFPTEEQGLLALWEEPVLYPLAENWAGPYTDRKVLSDSWGNPFLYVVPDSPAHASKLPKGLPFGIISYGADKKEGGDGNDKDIVSWE